MSAPTLHLSTPSRLHFGLFAFSVPAGRSYGGVGVMIDAPRVELQIRPSQQFKVLGPMSERIQEFAARWARFNGRRELPLCEISTGALPPAHRGLGSGTQLALAVAAGLNEFCGLGSPDAATLAHSVGRAERSAVGSYGFVHGGFIVEAGRLADEAFAPLESRVELPEAWRFVLIEPQLAAGLAGQDELAAFAKLPPISPRISSELRREASEELAPSAKACNFERFSASLFRFGCLAGECFASVQGGPFRGPEVTDIVNAARALDVQGVGQSSWGPTVFALLPNDDAAQSFVANLRARRLSCEYTTRIVQADNRGVRITHRSPHSPQQEVNS